MKRTVQVVVAAALVVGAWYLVGPFVAGSFGYATRWPSSVPDVLSFDGRDYHTPTDCLTRAKTPFEMRRPYRVGSVPVLLGDDAPILAVRRWQPSDPAPVILTVERSDHCYVVYSLEGGP